MINLNKDNQDDYKKDKEINSKVVLKSNYEIGIKEFVVKKGKNVYIIENVKLTNKLSYKVKIDKLEDSLKKEIRDNNVKLKVKIGDISFDLE